MVKESNSDLGVLLQETGQMYRDLNARERAKIESRLSKGTFPEWSEIAGCIGLEINSKGRVMMGLSDKILQEMSRDQKDEIRGLAAFYGHYAGNLEGVERIAGVTEGKIEEAHGELNKLWAKVTGVSFDDWELLSMVLKSYLEDQENPGEIARTELGITDVHERPLISTKQIKRDVKKREAKSGETAKKLLKIIMKSDEN